MQQLTESIQMQSSGPREAIETIRKKLKHGGNQQKLRVLEVKRGPFFFALLISTLASFYDQVLKLLMENSSQQFHSKSILHEQQAYSST